MDEHESPKRRSAASRPGFDEEDPYEGEDLTEYPDWWRENVDLFESHNMRPYRPPRFSDGELVPIVIQSIEEELASTVAIRSKNPTAHKEWEVVIDDETVGTVEHERHPEGYSLYKLDSEEFRQLVVEAAG